MLNTRTVRGFTRCGRVLAFVLLFVVVILPRSAGAFVVHAHTGHGLHVHLVSVLEDHGRGLDRDAFHAKHHAHAHPGDDAHAHASGDVHGGPDVFLGLVPQPLSTHAVPAPLGVGMERTPVFLADAVVSVVRWSAPTADRWRPPQPRGRALRSGTRALIQTSSALRL